MSSLFLDSSAHVPTLFELPAPQRAALAALGARLTADPVTEPDAFGRQARLLARELSVEVTEALWAFEERGSDSGVLVLRGLEVGELPPTPADNTGGIGGGGPPPPPPPASSPSSR